MRPLAVIDTSVVILLLTEKSGDTPEEKENDRKRRASKTTIAQLARNKRLAIPAVVLAELGGHGNEAELMAIVGKELGRFRLVSFGRSAALVAAQIAGPALKARRGTERGAVKYDVLIVGTAIAAKADCIVTENQRDFRGILMRYGATGIDVIVPSEPPPPKGGQLNLDQVRPKDPPADGDPVDPGSGS